MTMLCALEDSTDPRDDQAVDQSGMGSRSSRRWLWWLVAALGLFLTAITLFGFQGVPFLIRHFGLEAIHTELGRNATLESISFDPLSLELRLNNLRIKDAAGEKDFVSLAQLRVAPLASSLWRGDIRLVDVSLTGLTVQLTRQDKTVFNFQDIIDRIKSENSTEDNDAGSAEQMRIAVDSFRIKGSRIVFSDHFVPGGFTKSVDLELKAEGLSTANDGKQSFVATLSDGEEVVRLDGVVSTADATVQGSASLTNLNAPRYAAYFKHVLPVGLDSALVKTSLDFQFNGSPDAWQARLTNISTGISDVSVSFPETGDAFGLSQLQFEDGSLELDAMQSGAPQATFNGGSLDLSGLKLSPADGAATLQISGAKAKDFQFTTAPTPQSDASQYTLTGITVDLDNLRLVGANGTDILRLSEAKAKNYQFTTVPTPQLALNSLTLNKAALPGSPKEGGFQRLSIADLLVPFSPLELEAASVHIVAPRVAVGTTQQGFKVFGLEKLLSVASSPGEPDPATQTPTPGVRIRDLRVEQGELSYIDDTLSPAFHATLNDIRLDVGNFTLHNSEEILVNLAALVDHTAPLSLTGNVSSPLRNTKADLNLQLENLELPVLSAYTARYLAYPIQGGLLTMHSRIKLDRSDLDIANELQFKSLRLGKRVQSPDAIKAPVELGLALLQDSKGDMSLNVPVHGDIDNPTFNLDTVIAKAIGGALSSIVAAPFKLLGALFSIGEDVDLDYVRFAPGKSALAAAARTKLEALAKILAERPRLGVTLTPLVSRPLDGPALADQLYQDVLKKRKLQELQQLGEAPANPAEVSLGSDEVPEFLAKVFEERTGGNPQTSIAEMERIVRQTMAANSGDFQRLAKDRAQAVVRYLTEEMKITTNRIKIGPLPQDHEDETMVRFEVELE